MSTRTRAAAIAGALLIAATSITGVVRIQPPGGAADRGRSRRGQHGPVRVRESRRSEQPDHHRQLHPARGPGRRPELLPVRPRRPLRDLRRQHRRRQGRRQLHFRFKTTRTVNNFAGIPTFLFNDGPVTSLDRLQPAREADLRRLPQRREDRRAASKTPPPNIGPRSTPNSAALAAAAVTTLGDGTKVFAGQRDDAFFVDLGSIFDLGGLRPFNGAHVLPLAAEAGHDGVSGFNTNSIAIKVPLQHLTKDHALPTGPNDPDAVLGVWAAASRKKNRTIKQRRNHQGHRPVEAGLAARQPADQRGRHPDGQEGLLEQPEARQGLAVRQLLPRTRS